MNLNRIFSGAFWIAKNAAKTFFRRTTKTGQTAWDAKADLSLRWAHMSKGVFFSVAAHLITLRGLETRGRVTLFFAKETTIVTPRLVSYT